MRASIKCRVSIVTLWHWGNKNIYFQVGGLKRSPKLSPNMVCLHKDFLTEGSRRDSSKLVREKKGKKPQKICFLATGMYRNQVMLWSNQGSPYSQLIFVTLKRCNKSKTHSKISHTMLAKTTVCYFTQSVYFYTTSCKFGNRVKFYTEHLS